MTITLQLDVAADLVHDVAELLTASRHAARLSQRQLAAAAGVGHSMIAAYETGRRHPTMTTLARLLHASGARVAVTVTPADHNADDDLWPEL